MKKATFHKNLNYNLFLTNKNSKYGMIGNTHKVSNQ